MGCFDSNCCLTGLPIHYRDDVRAAIVIHDPERDGYFGSPASQWQFFTVSVKSQYNDYGNIELDSLDGSERIVLDLFLRMWRPGLELDEQYPSQKLQDKPKSEWNLETIWNGCYHGDLRYDPNRWRRQEIEAWQRAGCPDDKTKPAGWAAWRRKDRYPVFGTKELKIQPWMCHSWAWDALYELNTKLEARTAEELDCFCWTSKAVSQVMKEQFGEDAFRDNNHPNNAAAEQFYFNKTNRDCTGIVGKNGAFHRDLRQIVQYLNDFDEQLADDFVPNIELFKGMLLQTVQATYNMWMIRKTILPMSTCGEQHESFEHLPKWTKLVATECRKLARKYN